MVGQSTDDGPSIYYIMQKGEVGGYNFVVFVTLREGEGSSKCYTTFLIKHKQYK